MSGLHLKHLFAFLLRDDETAASKYSQTFPGEDVRFLHLGLPTINLEPSLVSGFTFTGDESWVGRHD